MKKLWLIIQREYAIRVKKKMFIVTTLLTPIGFGLLMLVTAYLAKEGSKTDNNVLVKDETGILANKIENSSTLNFTFDNAPLDSLKKNYSEQDANILLYIEKSNLDKITPKYFSKEKLGIVTIERIESKISKAIKEHKIDASGIDRTVYDGFATNVSLENGAINDISGESDSSSKQSTIIATAIGGFMAFLMYMVIFIYGGMVMRSVMEEKINRIVEVMISSVKPFQLMLGKVIGVGAVGLTQVAIWILLIGAMVIGANMFLGGDSSSALTDQMGNIPPEAMAEFDMQNIIKEFMGQNWLLIIPVFILFFFGGYFIYSALFAAIGSAVGDDMGESQQLMMPIVIPVVIAFVMAQSVIQNPNGSMAVFGSMFPLFSPILMPVRLAFDPPMWQIILSLLILILSCIFFAWLAGRIYRIGILMYGKKVTFREIGKWLFYKG